MVESRFDRRYSVIQSLSIFSDLLLSFLLFPHSPFPPPSPLMSEVKTSNHWLIQIDTSPFFFLLSSSSPSSFLPPLLFFSFFPTHRARGERGQNVLRELLGPLVKEVLGEKDLVLHTGPVDVYRAWINQMETQTGEAT